MDPQRSNRLISIDALRGIAALCVVLLHLYIFIQPQTSPDQSVISTIAKLLVWPLRFGRTGVLLFFVISGFCIHLRWANNKAKGQDTFPDFAKFWKRRIWRLYPTYFVVLIFAVFINLYLHIEKYDLELVKNVFMHMLLIHNISAKWALSLNASFWTLAVEEQLYMAYFLLLWIRNKWNWSIALIFLVFCRVAWNILGWTLQAHGIHLFTTAGFLNYWLLWALGAIGIEAWLGITKLPGWCSNMKLGTTILILTCSADYYSTQILNAETQVWTSRMYYLLIDPMWGLFFFIVLNWTVAKELEWQAQGFKAGVVRKLAPLGLISYSLYLVQQILIEHFPIRAVQFMTGIEMSNLRWIATITLIPTVIFFAWLYFQLVERYFVNPRKEWSSS